MGDKMRVKVICDNFHWDGVKYRRDDVFEIDVDIEQYAGRIEAVNVEDIGTVDLGRSEGDSAGDARLQPDPEPRKPATRGRPRKLR